MRKSLLETLRFDSHDFEESHAFEAYRDLYSGGSHVEPTGDAFSARMSGIRFPRLLLFDRFLQGVSHERSTRRVSADGFDHLTLQLVIEGRMMSLVDNVARVIEAGDIIVFDLTRPQRTWIPEGRVLTIAMAREVVRGMVSPFTNLHGLVLPASGNALLRDFLQSLGRNGATTGDRTAATATATVGALLGTTLGVSAGTVSGMPLFEAAKRNQILDFIEANLARPDLTAALIASRTGVSRSVLYRMFEPLGGVATRVQQRRLHAMRRALSRGDDVRSIREVARTSGFASASHANRSFREAFGMTPGEFRQSIVVAGAGPARDASPEASFKRWFVEVR